METGDSYGGRPTVAAGSRFVALRRTGARSYLRSPYCASSASSAYSPPLLCELRKLRIFASPTVRAPQAPHIRTAGAQRGPTGRHRRSGGRRGTRCPVITY
ncbi:hypothetical protein GCM10023405_14490 [Streptomonospora salina]